MIKLRLAYFVLTANILAIIISCSAPSASNIPVEENHTIQIQPGDTIVGEFIHDDSLRSYLLYVPTAYDGSKEWPLVISFHGFTSSAKGQMKSSQMNLVADTANFLVVYPQGLVIDNYAAKRTAPGWNIGGIFSNDYSDIEFTKQLIYQVSANFEIDKQRIFATGYSLGSMLAFQVACELADVIASVAGVSGQMARFQMENCRPNRAISTLLIHGTADKVAPFNGYSGLSITAVNQIR